MDYLICPICNAKKKQLTKHVTMAHKISKEEFLEMYPGTQMISDSTRKKHIAATKENWKMMSIERNVHPIGIVNFMLKENQMI